jgi:hypothetical protein
MPTEKMLQYFPQQGAKLELEMDIFAEAMNMTDHVFPEH